MPALGFSLFLLAIGAILAFAVRVSVSGVDIATIGIILMVVGAVGMVLSLLFWTSFAPFAPRHVDDTLPDQHEHLR
jgi:hypothetical protein